jgi:5-methylthioadenosine/S-adenosylhomocysteine deaminase
MGSLLIHNCPVICVNAENDTFESGYILIVDDRISMVKDGPPPAKLINEADEAIDADGLVLMPGLINGHVHLQQTLVRGMSDDGGVMPWVYNIAFPVYLKMTAEEIYLAELVGIIENIRGGATAVINNLTVRPSPYAFDACLKAGKESGIRYKLARGFNERGVPDQVCETREEILTDMHRLTETYHNSENGRIRVDFNPHTLALVTKGTLLKVFELSQEWGNGIHLHTAESLPEVQDWVIETGKRQVEWLNDLGILGPHFQLAHSVHLDDHEIELVARSGACMIHNPVSNCFTGAGFAPVLKLLKAGATVALGTDGQAVANGREMLDVLTWTVNLQKAAYQDMIGIGANEILRIACHNGSIAFGMPEQIGRIEVGKKADVILIDLNKSRLTRPTKNLPSMIVNFARAGDVDTAIVDGKILMRNGKILFLDEPALLQEFQTARELVLMRAGLLM